MHHRNYYNTSPIFPFVDYMGTNWRFTRYLIPSVTHQFHKTSRWHSCIKFRFWLVHIPQKHLTLEVYWHQPSNRSPSHTVPHTGTYLHQFFFNYSITHILRGVTFMAEVLLLRSNCPKCLFILYSLKYEWYCLF